MPTLPTAMEVVFDSHEYRLSAAEEQALRDKLDGLASQVEQFPIAELRISIQRVRSKQVVVKLALLLPGKTLAADDYDVVVQPAFERCLDALIHELDRYKDRLNQRSDAAKLEGGTHQELQPAVLIEPQALDRAVKEGDYPAFYQALLPLEEELRMRVGRWVQRYPGVDDVVGRGIEIADIVEETLLLAFEGYSGRPQNVPLGDWLEGLIDPAMKALSQRPEEAMENIAAVRTERDAAEGRNPP